MNFFKSSKPAINLLPEFELFERKLIPNVLSHLRSCFKKSLLFINIQECQCLCCDEDRQAAIEKDKNCSYLRLSYSQFLFIKRWKEWKTRQQRFFGLDTLFKDERVKTEKVSAASLDAFLEDQNSLYIFSEPQFVSDYDGSTGLFSVRQDLEGMDGLGEMDEVLASVMVDYSDLRRVAIHNNHRHEVLKNCDEF